MKKIILLALLYLLNGCTSDKSKKIEKKAINFSTNDASEMFFKNIRQTNYLLEEKVGTTMNVFRHKEYQTMAEDEGRMKVSLVHNWKDDLAYLLIELSEKHAIELQDSIVIMTKAENVTDTITYNHTNVQDQIYFLTTLYNSILDDESLYYLSGSSSIAWTKKETEIFRTTCSDFYRLVNAYQP